MSAHWHSGLVLAQDAVTQGALHWQRLLEQIFATLVFVIIGLAFFALSDWFIERVMPRSVRKAIEEEKNVALAIVIASVVLGIALIISAAIRG
jgi:uncharacterized membrane protein YjfL (UPF0719 family)